MRVVQLAAHPTDDALVVAHTPPDMSADMGRFAPARYAPGLKAYVLHRSDTGAFERFARYVGAHVVPEPQAGEATLPHECRHCARPGSVSSPPRHCPECGEPWSPVTHRDVDAGTGALGTCGACGHRQRQAFPRCSRCGGSMRYDRTERRVELPRTRLPDPVPLAAAIADHPMLTELEEADQ